MYGIAFCPLSDSQVLKTLGCADSKQLTEETREIIFDDMNRKEYANTTVGYVQWIYGSFATIVSLIVFIYADGPLK